MVSHIRESDSLKPVGHILLLLDVAEWVRSLRDRLRVEKYDSLAHLDRQ